MTTRTKLSLSVHSAFNGVTSDRTDTKQIPLTAVATLGDCKEVKPDPNFVWEYRTLRRTLRNLGEGYPVWAWGPSGCGKTEMAVQLGAVLQRPVFVVSFGEESSIRELLGTFELGSGHDQPVEQPEKGLGGIASMLHTLATRGLGFRQTFAYGQLAKAITTPNAIVVLDEVNMAPPGITAQMNRLLEARCITIPDTGEVLRCADNVWFYATANTAGTADESGIFAGSQVQNGATRNRFRGLKFSYLDEDQESVLMTRAFPDLDQKIQVPDASMPTHRLMIQVAGSIRVLVEQGRVGLPFSVRTLKGWASGSRGLRDITDGFRDAYFDLLSPSEATPVAEVFHKTFGLRLD